MSEHNKILEENIALKNQLYDSVKQNLRLLSLIELSKQENSAGSPNNEIPLVCSVIQDTIPELQVSLIIYIKGQWYSVCRENKSFQLHSKDVIFLEGFRFENNTPIQLTDNTKLKEHLFEFSEYCGNHSEDSLIYP